MYIKYEMFRSKNNEMFNSGMVEIVLRDDKDLIAIDDIISGVMKYHIQQLPEIKKYGTGYIGSVKLISVVINDNDYVSGLNEEAFKGYMANINQNITVEWNRTTNNTTDEQKPVKTEPQKNKRGRKKRVDKDE